MFQEAFKNYSDIKTSILGLGIFLVVFVLASLWSYRRSARGFYEQMGNLPLSDQPRETKP